MEYTMVPLTNSLICCFMVNLNQLTIRRTFYQKNTIYILHAPSSQSWSIASTTSSDISEAPSRVL